MNKSRWFLLIAIVFMMGCSISRPRFEARDEITTSIPVDGQLEFEASTFNGNIRVHEGTSGSIEVVARRTARGHTQEEADSRLEALKPDFETNASRIKWFVSKAADRTGYSDSVAIEVLVPSHMKLNLRTSNGAVECSDRKADVEIETSNGGIRLERVEGTALARTSNGLIDVVASKGAMLLESSNGAIHLKTCSILGDSTIVTSNGSIQLELLPTSRIELAATTSNGVVRSSIANASVKQTSKTRMEGVLFSEEVASTLRLDVRTSNGNVEVSEANEKEETVPEIAL